MNKILFSGLLLLITYTNLKAQKPTKWPENKAVKIENYFKNSNQLKYIDAVKLNPEKLSGFSALSGMLLSEDGTSMLLVSDRTPAKWFDLTIEVNTNQLEKSTISKKLEGFFGDNKGNKLDSTYAVESLAEDNKNVYVSFDQEAGAYIYIYDKSEKPNKDGETWPAKDKILLKGYTENHASGNGGIEAITICKSGELLVIHETKGSLFAKDVWIVNKPQKDRIAELSTSFMSKLKEVKGATTLKNGNVLVLEKSYTDEKTAFKITEIKRCNFSAIENAISTTTLLSTEKPEGNIAFDNFEGIASFKKGNKEFVLIISDDNKGEKADSNGQNTLLLLFELKEKAPELTLLDETEEALDLPCTACNTCSTSPCAPYLIEFNFKAKRFTTDFGNFKCWRKFKAGSFYQIRITDINQNLYKIKINKKDSTFNVPLSLPTSFDFVSTIGDLLGGIPSFVADITKSVSEDAVETIADSTAAVDDNSKGNTKALYFSFSGMDKDFEAIRKNVVALKKEMNKLKQAKNLDEILKKDKILEELKISIYEARLTNGAIVRTSPQFLEYKNLSDKVEALLKMKGELLANILTEQSLLFPTLKEEITDLTNAVKAFLSDEYSRMQAAYLLNTQVELSMNNFRARLDPLKDNIISLHKKIMAYQAQYTKNTKNYTAIINAFSNAKTADGKNRTVYNSMIAAMDTLSNVLSIENIKKIEVVLTNLINNGKSEYTSMPFQFTGDISTFNLAFTPYKTEYELPSFEERYELPVHQPFYVGVGLSYYVSSLVSDVYSVGLDTVKNSIDTSTYYTLQPENKAPIEYGIATLLQFGGRWRSGFGLQGAMGVGVSFSDAIVRPRVLLGGGMSYSFAKNHLITFNIGGLIGPVDRLSNSYSESHYYEKPENYLVSNVGIGFFGSIGYLYRFGNAKKAT